MALGIGFQKQPGGCQIWGNTCSVLGPAWAAHLPCPGKAKAQTSSAGSSQTFLPLWGEKKIEAAYPRWQLRTPQSGVLPSSYFVGLTGGQAPRLEFSATPDGMFSDTNMAEKQTRFGVRES